VYEEKASDSDSDKFVHSILNSLAIVGFFIPMTFTIVLCYYFNCMRLLGGYMLFSSSMLLGNMGFGFVLSDGAGHPFVTGLVSTLVKISHTYIDSFTYYLAMWNFALVSKCRDGAHAEATSQYT
jgi:hypothetical protein